MGGAYVRHAKGNVKMLMEMTVGMAVRMVVNVLDAITAVT